MLITIKTITLIAIVCLIAFASAVVYGGSALSRAATTITPTPAPSKTPSETPSIATPAVVTTEPATHPKFPLSKPFTQDDLAVLTGNIQRPNGLAWFDNKLYTSCSGDWTVYQIDTETGDTAQYIYGVKNAHSMYVTSENDLLSLWIPDFQNNTLTHIIKGTSQIVVSNLKGPWGITPLSDGSFVITNLLGNTIISVTPNGDTKELVQNLRSPAGVSVDSDYLYVANTGSARRAIEWYALSDLIDRDTPLDSSDKSFNASLVTGLQNVTNLVAAADGYLYFSYSLGTRGVVGRVDPNICREQGGCGNDDVEIVLYSELAAPLAGLTISPDMRLYVHSIFSPDIYWLQLDQNAADASSG
jgi:hypothetical protein